MQISHHFSLKLFTCIGYSLLALFLTIGNATAQTSTSTKPLPDNPLPELQGRWYAAREKVTLDIKDNVVTIVENTSTASGPTHAQYRAGLVIARLENPVADPVGKQVNFRGGECWTTGGGSPGYSLQKCPESGMAYYETRSGKPHWKVYIGNMILLRKEQLKQWESSRK